VIISKIIDEIITMKKIGNINWMRVFPKDCPTNPKIPSVLINQYGARIFGTGIIPPSKRKIRPSTTRAQIATS